MEEYTTKLDENGKIILPEEFRKRYSIFPGDELIISDVSALNKKKTIDIN